MQTDSRARIQQERVRQVKDEGYTLARDAEYVNGELIAAGDCYFHRGMYPDMEGVPVTWPWPADTFKPKDPESNFVRAGALALAEKERLLAIDSADPDAVDVEWQQCYHASLKLFDACIEQLDKITVRNRQPMTTDEMIRTIIAAPMIDCPNPTEEGMVGCVECARTAHPGKHYTSGGIRTNAQLMVRMVDGPFYSVKDVEVEVHDPEESVGGTTVWLTVEEY